MTYYLGMKYSVTAKLWIELDADNEDEAREKAKQIADDALFEYVHNHDIAVGDSLKIHRAKVIWSKENNL